MVQQFRSPRVQKLLCQNDPPLEMEISNIHETIISGTTAVSLLDERILEAQRILGTFISEREEVLSCINDARSLLHPIRTINDDILREIFSWCVYDWEDIVSRRHGYHDSLGRLEPPWTLSHVSHRWRTISLSSPRLWTSVILNFSSYSDLMIPHRNIMFKFGLQLERSRGCDLSVSLSSGLAGIGDHPILAMLDASSSRWKHLRAILPPEALRSLSGNSFTRLDTLVVRICTRRNSPPLNMKVDTFQSTAQLRTFRSLDDANPSRVLLLPWSNLIKYDCSDALSPHNLTILPWLTSVETLTFTLNSDSKNPPGGTRIVMPSVTSLTVHEYATSPEGAICRLLASVAFPSATFVNMSFPMNEDRIIRFPVHAVFGELRALRLTLNVFSDQTVRALLEFLTVAVSVVDLRLCMNVVRDSLLDGLTVSQSHRILPNLRTLALHPFASPGVSPFTPTVLVRMLQSRYMSMKERMSDGTTDINGTSTIGTDVLKELRLKLRRKLPFANLEDRQGWKAICEEIKVVYE